MTGLNAANQNPIETAAKRGKLGWRYFIELSAGDLPMDKPDISYRTSTDAAFEAFEDADWLRLAKAGRKMVTRFGFALPSYHRSPDDLVQEACTLTVSGDRRWQQTERSLVDHLLMTMASIVWTWAHNKQEYLYLESDAYDENRHYYEPRTYLDPERIFLGKELFGFLKAEMPDSDAQAMFELWAMKYTRPEIVEKTGANPTQCATIMRRVQRQISKLRRHVGKPKRKQVRKRVTAGVA